MSSKTLPHFLNNKLGEIFVLTHHSSFQRAGCLGRVGMETKRPETRRVEIFFVMKGRVGKVVFLSSQGIVTRYRGNVEPPKKLTP